MGENQGMVWIILGVIIVGAVVLLLGGTMKSSVSETNDAVTDQSTTASSELSIDGQ